jgi:hypothetical protein
LPPRFVTVVTVRSHVVNKASLRGFFKVALKSGFLNSMASRPTLEDKDFTLLVNTELVNTG